MFEKSSNSASWIAILQTSDALKYTKVYFLIKCTNSVSRIAILQNFKCFLKHKSWASLIFNRGFEQVYLRSAKYKIQ